MNVIKCDRCGEETRERSPDRWWRWKACELDGGASYTEYDLCPTCDSEFEEWMKAGGAKQ